MVARAQLVTVLGSDDGLLSQVVADLFDMGMRVRWAAGTPADFPHLISIRDSLGRSAEDFDLRPMASSKGEWAALMAGATYVLAGPVPWPIGRFVDEVAVVQRRSDWIKRLMTTARHCGVRRVLLISGPAAVAGGHRGRRESFTEDDWSVLGDLSDPLVLASTTSEQVAWHEARQNHQDLVVVAPSTLIGPSAGPMQPAINQLLSRLVAGRRLTLPELAMDLVDLGDVAELICLALVTPRMAGERLLAGSGASIGWSGLVELLVGRLQALGRGEVVDRLRPLRRLGLPVSAMVANLWPAWRSALPFMGQSNSFDSSKAAYWLNWQSRSLSASLDDWLRVNLPTGLEINFEEGRGSDVDYQPAGGHSGFQAGTGAVADS